MDNNNNINQSCPSGSLNGNSPNATSGTLRAHNDDNDNDPDPFSNFGSGGPGGNIDPDDVPDSFRLEYIGGLDEQKEYLQRSIILPLVRPYVLKEWGVVPPKGILLHGPPGTGKTFLAKALVNELKNYFGKVNFFYRKGGDVFSMWFGESQKKLRQVFAAAKAMQPSVIFFDEIDGLCPSRENSHLHGTEAYSSVVTCFLGQMDCLENGNVFVIAATNRLEAVDPAVRRPGRFDKHLAFGFPDEQARQKIIEIHTGKWSINDRPGNALVEDLAKKTVGFSGADLEKLCKDVVYCAIEANGGDISGTWRIRKEDWIRAMRSMKPTAANNFGSYLYIPTKPDQVVSKLIHPVVEQAIEFITPMLTSESLNEDSYEIPWIKKSFLLYTTSQQQSESFLNKQILPEILSSGLFKKMPIFELSTATVLNKVISALAPTIPAVIENVVIQAQDAQKTGNCVVVFIPNINQLIQIAKANRLSSNSILGPLRKIQGPNMFLLATSSKPLDDIKESGIDQLFFHRSMAVNATRQFHLKQFFTSVLLDAQSASLGNPGKIRLIQNVAAEAAKIADGDSCEKILSLIGQLAQVKMEQGPSQISVEFNNILDEYVISKL